MFATIKYLFLIEWKKYCENSLFRLLGILYMIILPAALFAGKEIYDMIYEADSGMNEYLFAPQKIVSFPNIWEYLGFAGNWSVYLFIAFVGIFVVTSEVQYKTMRQTIINGLTRQQYFLSKVITIATVSLAATLYYSLIAGIIGLIFTDNYNLTSWGDLWAIPRYFLMVFNYLSFAMLLGILLRKSGLAIFLFIAYTMMEQIIFRPLVGWKISRLAQLFFPINVNEDLTPLPVYRITELLPKHEDWENFRLLSFTEAVITASIFTAFYLFASYQLIKRRDC